MTDRASFYDYKIFLKENLKIILFSMVAIALTVLVVFLPTNGPEPTVPNYHSYGFRVYIENENHTTFTNNELVQELLTQDDLIETIQEEIDIQEDELQDITFAVSTTRNSQMLQIEVASKEPENIQQIAQFYYEYMRTDQIDILENKTIHFIDSEPIQLEGPDKEVTIVETPKEVSFLDHLLDNLDVIFIMGILGLLGGLTIGLFLALIKERWNERIPSVYHFARNEQINLANFDAIEPQSVEESDNIVLQGINRGNKKNKLILSESALNERLLEKLNQKAAPTQTNYTFNSSTLEEAELDQVDEIIVFVQIYKTSKKWFEKQMEQLQSLELSVTVIRLPIRFENFKEN